MATADNRRKWRNFLIHPGFQLRLALGNLIFLIAVVFFFCFVLLLTFYYDVKMTDSLWSQYASAEVFLRLLERGGIMIMVIIVIHLDTISYFPIALWSARKHEAYLRSACKRRCYAQRSSAAKRLLESRSKYDQRNARCCQKSDHRAARLPCQIAALARQLPHGPVENRLQEGLKDHQKLLDQWW